MTYVQFLTALISSPVCWRVQAKKLTYMCRCLDSRPRLNICLCALNLDGDARRTQRIYTGSGRECPTSSVEERFVLSYTRSTRSRDYKQVARERESVSQVSALDVVCETCS